MRTWLKGSALGLAIVAGCGGGEAEPPAPGDPNTSSSGDAPHSGSSGAGDTDGGDPTPGAGSSSSSGSPGSSGSPDADTGEPGAVGSACNTDDQCEGLCEHSVCAAPTVFDAKRSPSLGETDIDCGGPLAPSCDDDRACQSDYDCDSRVCSASGRCSPAPSCRGALGAAGIDTCGGGETGQANAEHESCCRSLPLPNRTDRSLDRYEITAGRLRAFVEAMNDRYGVPDIRRFAKDYASANPSSQLADIARLYRGFLDILPESNTSAPALPVHLGAFPVDPMNNLDGCYVGVGSYGHATYWQPPEVLRTYGIGPQVNGQPSGARAYPREVLDEKSVNCVMPLMLATFCAWDGGELARTRDYWEVWGRNMTTVGAVEVSYPWQTLLPWSQFNWHNGRPDTCISGWPGCENAQFNTFYYYPTAGFDASLDLSPLIAAPGRFRNDVTAIRSQGGEGWYDIAGNLLEAAWFDETRLTSSLQNVCDVSVGAGVGAQACQRAASGDQNNLRDGTLRYRGLLPGMDLVGFSFEGHSRYGQGYLAPASFDDGRAAGRPLSFQYGKSGGRCARPGR